METQGNPRKPSQLQRKPGGNPPPIALTPPLRPYKAFTLHRAFRFWAQTPRRLHSIGRGNTQHLGTLSGQDSLTRALKMSCHLELNFRWLGINPHHSLQVDACGMQTHARDNIGLSAGKRTRVTSGNPIGLAGRRLSGSAKVSSAKNMQVSCFPVQALMWLSVSTSCEPLTSPSYPHTNSWEQRASAGNWPQVTSMATMYSTTGPLMPLENLWAWFISAPDPLFFFVLAAWHNAVLSFCQKPSGNPLETQGNPHSCNGNPEVTPL